MSKLVSLFFIFFFYYKSMAVESNSYSSPNCPALICGGLTFSYPFYELGTGETTSQFCGYHGFGYNCSIIDDGSDRPIIYLGNDSFIVLNITYESSSITLVDYDVSTVVALQNPCPRVHHNINIETLPFSFSPLNLNLSFHFNCTGKFPSFATEIPCLTYSDKNRSSCVIIGDSDTDNFDWDAYSCEDQVVTAVFRDQITVNGLFIPGNVFIAMQKGFEIRWGKLDDQEDCDMCEQNDGRCGQHNTNRFLCFCLDGTTSEEYCKKGDRANWKIKLLIGSLSAAVSIVLIIIICCLMKSLPRNCVHSLKPKTEEYKSVEAFITQYGSLITKRYKYVDIKKMTNSFQVLLGKGGFGTVFKGKLSDGRLVAVKILNSSKASGQEFINEVASIGRTSHVNIVTLLGFCFDFKKRALVYEFMPNGSLEKFIHSDHVPSKTTSEHIGVEKLYHIAVGVAQGLDYLHRGFTTRILHLDIKPHNILLDEDFCPKIADFGLAKLYSRKESIVSMLEARGTIGYIAPEVFNRNFGGVSHKLDVYSYGMLILEMVGGRKNVDAGVGSGRTSEIYFPHWIYSRLEKEGYLLDDISTTAENEYARKMTIVGLWCIQTDPTQRPSIGQVIDMLEGRMEALEVPPKPFFSSPIRLSTTTFSTSQDEPEISVVED
ncbi:LEAF RUST 10 DISEASE-RESISTANCEUS RECEPTOR-LIKE PROTEIN KINASE-like 2.1 [Rutidosis leptorrhynchoides]|uniref:LEAF RUST 10 DISEASE-RESISTANCEUS RECEPTOR-LIKE PROTEIN KINASE-like 2.1 n=1 Tax=Rutidosis leptorrhynchoides TaxID=125765 RepID=UPI003A98F19D